jgi:hypothetical protein
MSLFLDVFAPLLQQGRLTVVPGTMTGSATPRAGR